MRALSEEMMVLVALRFLQPHRRSQHIALVIHAAVAEHDVLHAEPHRSRSIGRGRIGSSQAQFHQVAEVEAIAVLHDVEIRRLDPQAGEAPVVLLETRSRGCCAR
jgi:hypothetical protein